MIYLITGLFLFIFILSIVFSAGLSAYFCFSKLKTTNKFLKGTTFVFIFLLNSLTAFVIQALILSPWR